MEARKARMVERVSAGPAERRERQPPDGSWALIDVLEHCLLVEEGVTAALAREPLPEKPRTLGTGGRYPWWVVRLVLKTGVRIKAPVDAILPKRSGTLSELTTRWERQRGALHTWLEAQPPAVISAPRFRHPLCGWLDVPRALTFIADHLGHHLRQLDRIERRVRDTPA
jgi:hypothetical protein